MTQNKASHAAPTIRTHGMVFSPSAEGLPAQFPFRTVFTLQPLIDTWHRRAAEAPEVFGALVERINARLAEVPALTRPIEDFALLNQHSETLDLLLRPVFPLRDWSTEMLALSEPFGTRFPYHTARFGARIPWESSGWMDSTTIHRMLYAYKAILHKFYGVEMQVDQPMILVVSDAEMHLDRYYKLNGSTQFVTLRNRKPVPKLTLDQIENLLRHPGNMTRWMAEIPPDHFEFLGLTLVRMTDVTVEVATASLKHVLLSSEASVTEDNFDVLQQEIRNLFREADLRLGLASIQGDGALNFHSNKKIWNSLRIRDGVRAGQVTLDGSFYAQVLDGGGLVAIKDLKDEPVSPLKTALLAQGVRSILLAPLRYGGRLVGLLELTSSQPGDLDALDALKLKEIESIFALAIHQNLEAFENRVTAIIRETYTAIHPTVAWRFREAAIAMLDRQKAQGMAQPEPIVFSDLYPLYGSADIRNSSQHRNEAIRADLIEHLQKACTALAEARAAVPLDLIDELKHRVQRRILHLETGWTTGDEAEIAEFIQGEVNPLLDLVAREHPTLTSALGSYRAETGSGLLSTRRRAYEASLAQINGVIGEALDADQPELQQIFPHYFEKYKTDGVEHTMYLGASLVPGRTFDPAYVRNLRLRQLIMCCTIARRAHQCNATLEVPLDIAQLILVQDVPLKIRFRLEEKKFDVDGAYSIRYEIVKRRIDKARVKETGERVTQPGQIAVIYSLDKEADEYLRYIEFLQSNGLLSEGVEHLELESLPGVSGLKALRVTVALHAPEAGPPAEEVRAVAARAVPA